MKNLFLIILLVLTAFSQVIIYRQSLISGESNGAPVLYWVTDANPARIEQIKFFRSWLKKNGYPDIDLKTDSANQQKVLIQGVTGVGGDVFDAGSASIPYFKTVGMLDDVTEDMRSFGVTESNCYNAILGDLFYEGRQYAYPCNAGANHYIVNVDTLKKYGMSQPAEVNDFDTFEKLGRDFVARANPPGKRLRFFASPPPTDAMTRSVGVSIFNETMTASAVNRPEYVDILRRMRKWTYEDHIIPTKADMDSISVEQGYGGSYPQLFANGNVVMIYFARYILIQIRAMKKAPEMSAMLAPH
ncbi:MAG: carbohydrate ABC transporter substrate-binding protein, partial [Spirochaetia bacterium]|nr:carbohydrate ABC transporter substrate-binding protein [Spirochaetia bacterium]